MDEIHVVWLAASFTVGFALSHLIEKWMRLRSEEWWLSQKEVSSGLQSDLRKIVEVAQRDMDVLKNEAEMAKKTAVSKGREAMQLRVCLTKYANRRNWASCEDSENGNLLLFKESGDCHGWELAEEALGRRI